MSGDDTTAGPARLGMVGWYDPGRLARTGVDVLVSTIFGRHADFRLVEALDARGRTPPGKPYDDYTCQWRDTGGEREEPDPTRPRDEMWLDYVADAGDGWNSTYAIAHALAQPMLRVSASNGPAYDTVRGDALIFGGDEVYPVANRTEYKERLVAPYECALARTDPPHPHVFAIPGNHDWYDSLVAFSRLFCAPRWFGGWRTRQRRSYFALKLPHGWWLLATDVQLGSDIDAGQVEYFRDVATHIRPHDRVILCNAEPHWVYSKYYFDYDRQVYNEGSLAFLERHVLGHHDVVKVFVAGDLHHYRRHVALDGTQKITAGGGGAFLHPTHAPEVETIDEKNADGTVRRRFRLETSWPDVDTSRRLAWRNLFLGFINPWFGIATAIMYLMVAWTVSAHLPHDVGDSNMVCVTLRALTRSPGAGLLVLAVVGVFMLFTDSHSMRQKYLGGTVHALAHLSAVFLLGWAVRAILGAEDGSLTVIAKGALVAAGGYVIGPFILGVYLLFSLNTKHRHYNEAFSSLRIEDWKHFLRLHIGRDGTLTIYPIGLEVVPRRWKPDADASGSHLIPDDPHATAPTLIEEPIRIVAARPG